MPRTTFCLARWWYSAMWIRPPRPTILRLQHTLFAMCQRALFYGGRMFRCCCSTSVTQFLARYPSNITITDIASWPIAKTILNLYIVRSAWGKRREMYSFASNVHSISFVTFHCLPFLCWMSGEIGGGALFSVHQMQVGSECDRPIVNIMLNYL